MTDCITPRGTVQWTVLNLGGGTTRDAFGDVNTRVVLEDGAAIDIKQQDLL